MKTLIFLCDNYPIAAREFFVDDEMKVVAPYFEKIVVLTSAVNDGADLQRYVPEKMEVNQFSRTDLEQKKWKSIWRLFTPMVIAELFFILQHVRVKHWWAAFKIMFVEVHRAFNLKEIIETYCRGEVTPVSADYVFYSYWHDYKAMALALMLKENPEFKCFARAHGWDVFAERQNPSYLPFKRFIIENLSHTISISEAGKKAFEDYLAQDLGNKVTVSRLGKFNHRKPVFEKNNDEFVICSCSNLIPVKRVDKIIDLLAGLQTQRITWIHFGDGPLRNQLEERAKTLLSHISFEFKGMVSNEKILDFYAERYVDLFINLSDSEGIPVSIMEALSAGIPVLATNVGGTGECVNSENGFLVEKNTSIENIIPLIDGFFCMDQDTVASKRTIAYEFWKNNYEASKNFTEFLNVINR